MPKKKICKQQHVNCESLRLVERLFELLQSTVCAKSSAKEMRACLTDETSRLKCGRLFVELPSHDTTLLTTASCTLTGGGPKPTLRQCTSLKLPGKVAQ